MEGGALTKYHMILADAQLLCRYFDASQLGVAPSATHSTFFLMSMNGHYSGCLGECFLYRYPDICQGLYLARVLLESGGLKLGGVRIPAQLLSYCQ